MELLSQKKVHAMKQEETRVSIQQGMELAAKVDVLRRTILDEEKVLAEQRDSIVASIRREAEEWNAKVESAKGELNQIYEQKRQLLIPLNDKWAEVNKAEASIIEKISSLEAEKSQYQEKNRILQEKIDQADQNIDASADMRHEAEVLLGKRKAQNKEIQGLSAGLARDIDRFNERTMQSATAHQNRERKILIRERELDIKEETLNKRERELNLYATSRTNH